MVPEGWKVDDFSGVGIAVIDGDRGSQYPKANDFSGDGHCVFLSAKNVTKSGLKFEDVQFISEEKHRQLRKGKVCRGNIILTTRGTVGQFGYFDEAVPYEVMRINSGMVVLDTSQSELSSEFLYAVCRSRLIEKQIESASFGSAQPALTVKVIKKIRVPVPPLSEQTKIAQVLSTWDQAITATKRLLENSQQRKKGLMQKLLTGKKRLPGFEGVWEAVEFGNLGSTYSGLSGKTKEDFGEGEPFVTYMGVFSDGAIKPDRFDFVRLSESESQNKVQYGDILFTTSSETPEEVGMASVLLENLPYNLYLNSFCFGFRLHSFENLVPEYAKYLFRGEDMRRRISTLAQGATRYNLSKRQLIKLDVLLPGKSEQAAISDILVASDMEISAVKHRLLLLQEEKKALMQQLLTGKRRVQVDTEAA
jgi:type I restriction enzyme S subunit